jgi:hypothetical protein
MSGVLQGLKPLSLADLNVAVETATHKEEGELAQGLTFLSLT